MDDEANVSLVNAHAERNGRHDDVSLARLPGALHLEALLGAHARVVVMCANGLAS